MYSVSLDSLNSLLQPVMHDSIGDNPLRFVLAEMCGDRPSIHLPDIAYVARRPPGSASVRHNELDSIVNGITSAGAYLACFLDIKINLPL